MKKSKIAKLQAAGWNVGSVEELLGLTKEEAALIEIKVTLAASLRSRRVRKKMTQQGLAEVLNSSQSRVAKMEAADASVSIDLLVRALLALGVTQRGVAKILAEQAA